MDNRAGELTGLPLRREQIASPLPKRVRERPEAYAPAQATARPKRQARVSRGSPSREAVSSSLRCISRWAIWRRCWTLITERARMRCPPSPIVASRRRRLGAYAMGRTALSAGRNERPTDSVTVLLGRLDSVVTIGLTTLLRDDPRLCVLECGLDDAALDDAIRRWEHPVAILGEKAEPSLVAFVPVEGCRV